MNMSVASDGKAFVPPRSLEDWRSCAADLRRKQADNSAERDRLALLRQDSALAAARGDAEAQRRIAQTAAAETDLQLAAQSLDHGLIVAVQEIDAGEARFAARVRAQEIKALDGKLRQQLDLVAEVERRLRAISQLLLQVATLSHEIEQAHTALGGARPFLPPLAQEAVGGRLAEFLTGCGFAEWLPLARPEVRPPLSSWVGAEREIQETYRLVA